MKKVFIAALLLISFACRMEKNIVDNAVVYNSDLEQLAQKLFDRHFTDTSFTVKELGDWEVTKKEKNILKNKIKATEIFLMYGQEDNNIPDSLVIFTRGGTWEKEHTLFVDMKKEPRAKMPKGLVKLIGRIYYRQVQANIPIS